MNIFFTADLHLVHKNIIQHCKRPFESLAEHDETLIRNWNSLVGEGDRVYVLGDISLGNLRDSIQKIQQLRGAP